MITSRNFNFILLIFILIFSTHYVYAQNSNDYPSRTIYLAGQGAGSAADFLSRYIGKKLSEKFEQPVVIENYQNGIIPAINVARAKPDGYRLIMGNAGPFVSAPNLVEKLSYDPITDFDPVSLIATGPVVMVVHPSVNVQSGTELIALTKKNPNLTYSSGGNGTIGHLIAEKFKNANGISLLHIPYRGPAAALNAILSGEVQISFLSPTSVSKHIEAGKLKAIAISNLKRFNGMPQVPSAVEAGIPEIAGTLWFGIFTTKNTPKPIINKLNKEITLILDDPQTKTLFLNQGIEVSSSSPEQLGVWLRNELDTWSPIIKKLNIKID